jgi:hypothetical protein
MKFWINKKWRKLLRSLHRDLGYFFAGLTCLYAVSGILLNIKSEGEDPAYSEIRIEKKLKSNYSQKELKTNWSILLPEAPEITHIFFDKSNNYNIYVKGGMGKYSPKTGLINIRIYKERKIIKFINDIHYNQGKRFTWLANIFAIILIFFSISGLLIVKGKKGFMKRGVWLMIGGILLPILLYFL